MTLPGDIQGLLCHGSVVLYQGRRLVVVALGWDGPMVADQYGVTTVPWGEARLCLESQTSRAHAAWWFRDQHFINVGGEIGIEELRALSLAKSGRHMDPDQVALLRSLVVRAAGANGG